MAQNHPHIDVRFAQARRTGRGALLLGALLLAGAGASAFAQNTAPSNTAPSAPAQTSPAAAPAPLTPQEQARLDAAQGLLAAKKYKEARVAFEALIADRFENAAAHFGLGLALYNLNDLAGARFEFQQLVKLTPEGYEGHYNLGVVEAKAGNADAALQSFSRALELARGKAPVPIVTQLLTTIAAEQTRRADYAGLTRTLAEAVELNPTNDTLRLQLADATFRSGNGPDALPLAYAVQGRAPENADAARIIADIYVAQNLPDRALRELDKGIGAVRTNAARSTLLLRKAEVQVAQNDTAGAVESLKRASTLTPASAVVWARLGEQLVVRRDFKGAQDAWRAAVRAEPQNALYRSNLATVQLALGNNADAAATAKLAERDAKADASVAARARYVLGVAAYRQKNYAAAREALAQSAQAAPNSDTLLWLGLSEYALKNYPAAVTALQESVRVAPTLAARSNLGAAQLAAGQYADAEATLVAVVREDPKAAEAWFNLGWSRRGLGREDLAKQAFRTADKLGYARAKEALR